MAVVINGRSYPSGDDPHTLTLSDDEVLILFELFERLEAQDGLRFAHPGEWLALGRFTAQLESTLWQLFSKDWDRLLAEARARRSREFEGCVPGLGYVRVEEDGRVVSVPEPPATSAARPARVGVRRLGRGTRLSGAAL